MLLSATSAKFPTLQESLVELQTPMTAVADDELELVELIEVVNDPISPEKVFPLV